MQGQLTSITQSLEGNKSPRFDECGQQVVRQPDRGCLEEGQGPPGGQQELSTKGPEQPEEEGALGEGPGEQGPQQVQGLCDF